MKSRSVDRGFVVSIVGGGVGVVSIGGGLKWVPKVLGLHGGHENLVEKLFLHQFKEYLKNLGSLMPSRMSEKN
ncbi:hypothetical protein Tco_1441861 [Tanacetum coccineum]